MQDPNTLIENALAFWIRNKLRRAGSVEKKRDQSEGMERMYDTLRLTNKYGGPYTPDKGMDRGNFVRQAVGEGPKQAHALAQNLEIPTFLRKELKTVIGPYRPFAPGTKHVGEGGKTVHTAGPHAFYDASSGQRVNSDTGTVTIEKGANPRKVHSPMDESVDSLASKLLEGNSIEFENMIQNAWQDQTLADHIKLKKANEAERLAALAGIIGT